MNDERRETKDSLDREQETLKRLRAGPDRPRVLEFFEGQVYEASRAEGTAKVVGQLGNLVPVELIQAVGAVPVRLDLAAAQEDSAVAIERLKVDLVVVAGDSWKLADLSRGREVFVLEGAGSSPSRECHRLADRLSEITGNKISKGNLKEAIHLVDRQAEVARKLNQLRREARPAISGGDAYLVMQAAFVTDLREWTENAEILQMELEQRTTPDRGRAPLARVLLTGSPVLWPDYQVLFSLVDCGAEVVADDMCSGTMHLGKPTVLVDMSLDGLINTALSRTQRSCASDSGARKDYLVELVDAFRVDGVICLQNDRCPACGSGTAEFSALFEKRGVPWQNVLDGRVSGAIKEFVDRIDQKKPQK